MKRYQILSQKYPAVRMAVRYRVTPCVWKEVESGGKALPTLVAEEMSDHHKAKEVDAWSVRERFFAITKAEHLLPFLSDTGRFTRLSDREEWSYNDFERWKQIIRALLRTPPERWTRLVQDRFPHEKESGLAEKFTGRFDVAFAREGKFYIGIISTESTLLAMIASVYVDWMAGVKQGFCERPDCGKPFEITSAHKRLYCSQTCAHHEVVKRGRERVRLEREPKKPSKSRDAAITKRSVG